MAPPSESHRAGKAEPLTAGPFTAIKGLFFESDTNPLFWGGYCKSEHRLCGIENCCKRSKALVTKVSIAVLREPRTADENAPPPGGLETKISIGEASCRLVFRDNHAWAISASKELWSWIGMSKGGCSAKSAKPKPRR